MKHKNKHMQKKKLHVHYTRAQGEGYQWYNQNTCYKPYEHITHNGGGESLGTTTLNTWNVFLNTKTEKNDSEHLNYGTKCLIVALKTKNMAMNA